MILTIMIYYTRSVCFPTGGIFRMIADKNYKIITFGDFKDIVPTSDNMLFFIETFREQGLMPTIFQEFRIDNVMPAAGSPQIVVTQAGVPSEPLSQQRIALITSNNQEQVSIQSNRIDYQFTINEDLTIDNKSRKEMNDKVDLVLKSIFEKFGTRATRLALNSNALLIDLSPEEIKKFMSSYSNPISIYDDCPLPEWSTRLMTRKVGNIDGIDEIFNVITILSKASLRKPDLNGQVVLSEGFEVNIDINTIAENTTPRFHANSLKEFINVVNEWQDLIRNQMGL